MGLCVCVRACGVCARPCCFCNRGVRAYKKSELIVVRRTGQACSGGERAGRQTREGEMERGGRLAGGVGKMCV